MRARRLSEASAGSQAYTDFRFRAPAEAGGDLVAEGVEVVLKAHDIDARDRFLRTLEVVTVQFCTGKQRGIGAGRRQTSSSLRSEGYAPPRHAASESRAAASIAGDQSPGRRMNYSTISAHPLHGRDSVLRAWPRPT